MDVLIAYRNRQRFPLKSHTVTLFTGSNAHKSFKFLLYNIGSGLSVLALHIPNQTFKGNGVYTFPSLALIMYLNFSSAGSVNEHMINFFRILLHRCIQTEIIFLGQRPKNRIRKATAVVTGLPAHHLNGTVINTQTLIRNHQIRIEFHLITQTETYRAGTERIVKGKASGLNLTDADFTIRAGKTLTEINGYSTDDIHHQKSLCQCQYIFDGVGQSPLNPRLYHQTVHYNFNIMLNVLL